MQGSRAEQGRGLDGIANNLKIWLVKSDGRLGILIGKKWEFDVKNANIK